MSFGLEGKARRLASLIFLGLENEDHTINAPTLPSRCRAIWEHMALVGSTCRTVTLRSGIEQLPIGLGRNGFGPDRLGKARPTGAGIKLVSGCPQGRAAADAVKRTFALFVIQGRGKGPLCAFLPRDLKLSGRQDRLPFGIGFLDSEAVGLGHDNLLWASLRKAGAIGCSRSASHTGPDDAFSVARMHGVERAL